MEQPRAVEATITPRIRNGEIVLDDLNIDLSQIHKMVDYGLRLGLLCRVRGEMYRREAVPYPRDDGAGK